MKNRSLLYRTRFALHGIRAAWLLEKSFRIQTAAAVFVLAVLLLTRPATIWWALLLLICGLVLAAELFNSALEKFIDLLHPAQHETVKVIKDMLAGAILILSLTSLAMFAAFLFNLMHP